MGTLKVYLGAAVGVGKTYRMLEEARQLRSEGHDVVLGFVETHGRRETAALIGDLEVISLREVPYRGVLLKEIDVDAILARGPQFAIVDELPHTNVPGSRNHKRFQDVQELLAAGINVITALNIQHVESMGPIVKRLTGIIIHESVPDAFLASADEIVDVDVSVEELRERLREGKIYPIQQVNLALQNFFQPGNLNTLRELTLREVARDIGRRREEHARSGGNEAPHQLFGEHLLVCLPSDPHAAEGLLCKGWREASAYGAIWYALHVETPQESLQKISPRDFRALLDNVNLAIDLGAEFTWLKSSDVAGTIIDFANEKRISKIILKRPRIGFWNQFYHHSIVDRLFHEARNFDVEAVSDEP
ncbi:MAG: histidine kinase [Deltaproteobacteria bacterium]|nr:histidine kinase [Deltaproteobacteria bacterium]